MVKRVLPSKEELKRLYVEEKKNCKEICRLFGLSPNSSGNLSKELKSLGVEIRKDAGANHHGWKGGRIDKGGGYIGIWKPGHPRADHQGYVYEHTLVIEQTMGRLPTKAEVIHHIDCDKHNNSPTNLWLCGKKEHIKCHRSIEKMIKPLLEKGIIEFRDGEYHLLCQ